MGWNPRNPTPFQLSHLKREFIWPQGSENWLFYVLQDEWDTWCVAMWRMVTKYREEQQIKSVSSDIESLPQTPAIPRQSQSTSLFLSNPRFQDPVEPSTNSRHQSCGLGSIGSGRHFPQRSDTLDAFKGYQIWK